MGLFNTIKNMFREGADKANESLKDPVRDGKFAIVDAKKEVAEFQSAIQRGIANNKLIEKQLDEQKAKAKKYLGIAKKAAEAGSEADARQALELKAGADAQVKTLTANVKKGENDIANQRKLLDKTKAKIQTAENSHSRLAANLKANESRKALAEASDKFANGGSALSALDDLENAVNIAESEAEAAEEMSADPVEDLTDKYSGADDAVEAELAKLMGK